MRDWNEPVRNGEVRREDLVGVIVDLTDYDEKVVFTVDEVRDRLGYPSLRAKKQDVYSGEITDGKCFIQTGYGNRRAVRDLKQLEEEGLLIRRGGGYRINAETFFRTLAGYDESGADDESILEDVMAEEVGL